LRRPTRRISRKSLFYVVRHAGYRNKIINHLTNRLNDEN
jgi:hypothetical protein